MNFLKGFLIGGGFSFLVAVTIIYFSVYILPNNSVKQFIIGLVSGSVSIFSLFIAILYAF